MRAKQWRWQGALMIVLLLGACHGPNEAAEPTAAPGTDLVATSVRQTVEAIAVAQTVAAITGETPPVQLTPTEGAANPPPTAAAPSPAGAGESTAPGRCAVVSSVNLRSGPGTAYDPPLANLGANTALRPLAFSAVGFPLGQWLQVQVEATGLVGWVSAGPQWITCDADVSALPPAAVIPPTPQLQAAAPSPTTVLATIAPSPTVPVPTATRPLAAAPPDIDDVPPGGSFPTDHVAAAVIKDPNFLYRMDVRDLNVGDFEGAGIAFVEFSITGDGVDYYRKEENAGFCVFGGGEPTCNPWPTDELGRFTWGQGGPLVQSGQFFASFTVTAENEDPNFGTVWNWNFPFAVTLP